jgi:hypothetical protein
MRCPMINDKISIITEVDAHTGACVELVSQFGLPVSTRDITAKTVKKLREMFPL